MAIAASFAGNLGQDSELRYTPTGTAILSFSVATTFYANKEKQTQWVRCSMFGKRGETLAPMLLKGASVFVRGELTLSEFVPRNGGEKKVSLECKVDDVEFVGSKGDGGNRGATRPQDAATRPTTTPSPAGYGQGAAGYVAPRGNQDAESPFDRPNPGKAFVDDLPF